PRCPILSSPAHSACRTPSEARLRAPISPVRRAARGGLFRLARSGSWFPPDGPAVFLGPYGARGGYRQLVQVFGHHGEVAAVSLRLGFAFFVSHALASTPTALYSTIGRALWSGPERNCVLAGSNQRLMTGSIPVARCFVTSKTVSPCF